MDRQTAIVMTALCILLAGLSSVASKPIGHPDQSGAIAAAIENQFTEWLGVESITRGVTSLPATTLCLDSKRPLDIAAIAHAMGDTVITTVPVSECTSETVEGNFGMFTALTTYYDRSGEEAAHIEIADIRCTTTSACTVDIDSRGSGMRYEMERRGSVWHARKAWMRWIV